jgi:hypothetical protein
MVCKMCDDSIPPLQKHCPGIEGLEELIKAIEEAKRLPDFKQFCLAVLGEQGVAKSSLLNALLDRDLLDNSGSAQACTALATKIVHKKGAVDGTRKSDVTVEFLDDEEVRECIIGQVQCWTEMYPGPDAQQQESDGEEDCEVIDEPETPVRNRTRRTTKAKKKAAATAKDFFSIIFNAKEDKKNRQWLEEALHTTDIRTGGFLDVCCRQATKRLEQIGKKLGVKDGVARFEDVADRKVADAQIIARRIWPFVKLVTIATGHILLRHGLCFFDLPGKYCTICHCTYR